MNRDISIDFTKFILIYLVILGHFFQKHLNALPNNPIIDDVEYFIYAFHMPLFMFISGYLSHPSRLGFLRMFLTNFKRIIFPSIFWGGVILIIDCSYISDGIIQTLKKFIIIDLWYLKSYFVVIILSYPFIVKPGIFILIPILIVSLGMGSIYLLSLMVPSFILGWYLLYKNWGQSENLLIYSGIIFSMELFVFHPSLDVAELNILSSFDSIIIINYINRLLLAFSGCFFTFISINKCFLIFSTNGNCFVRRISTIGTYTMGIYIFQCIIVERSIAPFIVEYHACLLKNVKITSFWLKINKLFFKMIVGLLKCLYLRQILNLSQYALRSLSLQSNCTFLTTKKIRTYCISFQ